MGGFVSISFLIPKSLIFKNFNHKKNLKKKKKKRNEENMKSHTHTNIEPNTTVGKKNSYKAAGFIFGGGGNFFTRANEEIGE